MLFIVQIVFVAQKALNCFKMAGDVPAVGNALPVGPIKGHKYPLEVIYCGGKNFIKFLIQTI